MSSSRGKKAVVPASKKMKGASSSSGPTAEELFFGIIEPTYLEITIELCSTFHLQTIMTNYDDPSTDQFRLGGLVRQFSVPEFVPGGATYNPSRSKASALPPSLRHVIDLAYFIALETQHQTERRRKGEEAYEDIPDDVPPQHADPPSQPLSPSRPVHTAASYADISNEDVKLCDILKTR
ncbi:hypothetical protein GOBAR_AA07398 [Gossypium barbadense]|uniref:Uncharacterized protein n=1 Tax=Gossypium barbadense TaxID=3634 RepID=A0A2P5YCC5_GOSBA|nr:hypothetical protein GOBAR_AA07398 [Gossypium barbadense]